MKKLLCLLLVLSICAGSVISGFCASNTYRKGDINLNGDVEITDVTLLQRFIARRIELTNKQLALCDSDGDGQISITDATLIQRYIAQLIDKLPSDDTLTLAEYAEKVNSVTTDTTLTFSVFADMHYDEKNNITKFKNKKIEELGTLTTLTDIDFVTNLGDFVVGNEDKTTTLSSLNTLLSLTDEAISVPILNVRGNHDDNGWYSFGGYGGTYKEDEIINDKEWSDLALSAAGDKLVIDQENPYGGYGYMDFEDSKIRVFMLNSCDIPYILKEDGTYRYSSYLGHCFSNAQLNFVANSLMFSDKENPNDWAALFLTHVPIDTSNLDNERFGGMSALIRGYDYMLSIISAYRKGTSFKMSGSTYNTNYPDDRKEDFMVDVDIDYSKKGYGEVIGFFSGHTHSDNYSNQVGLTNSLSYGYTFIGTSGAEAFNTFVINRETKTINAYKYGPSYPEKTEGNIVAEPDTGAIEDGEWSVVYDQFLNNGKNLSNGLSEIHPLYTSFDSTLTTKINLSTLEVDAVAEVRAPRIVTKAVIVKPLTTYILPSEFLGECLTFNAAGSKRAYLRVTDHGTYKSITTGERTCYVAFSIDTLLYKDHTNFYLKELEYSLYS